MLLPNPLNTKKLIIVIQINSFLFLRVDLFYNREGRFLLRNLIGLFGSSQTRRRERKRESVRERERRTNFVLYYFLKGRTRPKDKTIISQVESATKTAHSLCQT